MFDLKVIHSVLGQLEDERGIPKEKVLEAIELALATAYKREYGKRGQIIKASFDSETGKTDFHQVKIVVGPEQVKYPEEGEEIFDEERQEEGEKIHFNPEHHILLQDAQKIKKGAKVGEEIIFPLENKADYGRIAAQTAKQGIIQKIREAEKASVMGEFSKREGNIVTGIVQKIERGNIYVDLGRAQGIIPYDEHMPGERYRQGERI